MFMCAAQKAPSVKCMLTVILALLCVMRSCYICYECSVFYVYCVFIGLLLSDFECVWLNRASIKYLNVQCMNI